MLHVTRFLMIRHAESEWNAQGRWQGHAEVPLSKRGELHAQEVGPLLKGFDAIVCSDLMRAKQTSEIIAAAAGIGQVRTEPRLRERDAGRWQGLSRDEIERGWPGFLKNGQRPDGYEHEEQLLSRVDDALADILAAEGGKTKNPGRKVLIVTHGGVIHGLKMRAGLRSSQIPNLSGHWLAPREGRLVVGERAVIGDAGKYSANPIEAALNPE